MMTTPDDALILALKNFPVNTVYYLAPKAEVLNGFRQHEEQRLEAYHWNLDHSVLEADIRVDGLHGVSFFLDAGKLAFSCDCSASKDGKTCAHIICAFLTTANLLTPTLFTRRRNDSDYLHRLEQSFYELSEIEKPSRAGLPQSATVPAKTLTSAVEAPELEIVLKHADHQSQIMVRRNGRTVYYDSRLPKELVPLSFWYSLTPGTTSDSFREFLDRHGSKYPIFLERGDQRIQLRWDASFRCRRLTGLNLVKDHVVVEALGQNEDLEIRSFVPLGDLVCDPETGRLGWLELGQGWALYSELDRVQDLYPNEDTEVGVEEELGPLGTGRFSIPLEQFRWLPIVLPGRATARQDDSLLLQVDGEIVQSQNAEVSYRLAVDTTPDKQGRSRLRATCHAGESEFPPHELFAFFTLFDEGYLPAPLKSQIRRTVMCDAFFKIRLTRQKSEGQKLIRETLAANDFSPFRYRRNASEALREALDVLLAEHHRLVPSGGRWLKVPCEKQKEMLLYQLPYLFWGASLFKDMNHYAEMALPSASIDRHLAGLHAQVEKHGIELFFDEKQVVAVKWDFTFDATDATARGLGIDWFEIRPEIRCNGAVVEEAVWLNMLQGHGVDDGSNEIHILDAESRDILQAVATLLPMGQVQRHGKREIVAIPRLQILDWIALRRKGVTVKLRPEDEQLIEGLTQFEKIEPVPLPEQLAAKLRPYQKEGYYWLNFLYRHQLGACLADDMGLGKTLQAIALLGGIREGKVTAATAPSAPHLIVLPPSLLFNWESELKRFYPELRLGFYTGKERTTEFDGYDVVLTTYTLVRKDIEKLKTIPFHVIVFDEAQAIKNIVAHTTGAVRHLRGYFKVALTGTPVENHLGEYFSILDLCLPGLLGDYTQFKSETKNPNSPLMDVMIRRTRPFVLRRTKEKILKELPPKTESDVYLELTDRQKSLYQQTVAQVRSAIHDAYQSKAQGQAQIIALTAILKLRQLCVSPRLLAGDHHDSSPKIQFLIEKLNELRDEGHSALVFSQFTSFLDILEEDLKAAKMPFSRLDGSTAVKKRKHLVEGFQNGEAPFVFLLSLKVGGQGLNLTRASYVFHLDPWWNPAVENQASDRAHRIGQTQKVSITRILMRHTIEEKMMELKKRKLALYKAVLEDSVGGRQGFSISKADFDFLLSG